jgi:DNA polymerase
MNKENRLKKIAEEISKCEECKMNKSGLPVPGEGNPNARIMFIGEAPGREEANTGRPFVGRSGKFLTKLLESIGISRKDVFITSPVKYYPGRRAPTNKEIQHGKKHLLKQIETINPKLIVLLGKVAHKALLEKEVKISRTHGKIFKKNSVIFFSTFHPSAGIRFPKIKRLIEKDFAKLKKLIKELNLL